MTSEDAQFSNLSSRGQITASKEGFLGKYLTVALNNPYDAVTNPKVYNNIFISFDQMFKRNSN